MPLKSDYLKIIAFFIKFFLFHIKNEPTLQPLMLEFEKLNPKGKKMGNQILYSISNLFSSTIGVLVVILLAVIAFVLPIPSIVFDLSLLVLFMVSLRILYVALNASKIKKLHVPFNPINLLILFVILLNVTIMRVALMGGFKNLENFGFFISNLGNVFMQNGYFNGILYFIISLSLIFITISLLLSLTNGILAMQILDKILKIKSFIITLMTSNFLTDNETINSFKTATDEGKFYKDMKEFGEFIKDYILLCIFLLAINISIGLIMSVFQDNTQAFIKSYTTIVIGSNLTLQFPILFITIALFIMIKRTNRVNSHVKI